MKSPDAEVRNQALALAVTFGDKTALATLRKVLADAKAAALGAARRDDGARRRPRHRHAAAPPGRARRQGAARRRAPRAGAFDDAKTPAAILAEYGDSHLRREARRARGPRGPAGVREGTDERGRGQEGVRDRRLRPRPFASCAAWGTPDLDKQIADLWGVVRDTAADRKKLIAEWKRKLTAPYRVAPDVEPRPGGVRQDVPQLPHALRGRRQGRPGDHRRQSRATSTTCSRTSSTRARSSRRSTPRRGSSPPTTAPSSASSRARRTAC